MITANHTPTASGLRDAIQTLEHQGFTGWTALNELTNCWRDRIPQEPGVYVVVRPSYSPPEFLETNPTRSVRRKRGLRNPTLAREELETRWVSSSPIVYIGKAGGGGSKAALLTRIGQYLMHGQGLGSNHWGGRAIWQLADSAELLMAWMPTPDEDAELVEKRMLREFRTEHGALPFANRRM